jgi:hypothetical protein
MARPGAEMDGGGVLVGRRGVVPRSSEHGGAGSQRLVDEFGGSSGRLLGRRRVPGGIRQDGSPVPTGGYRLLHPADHDVEGTYLLVRAVGPGSGTLSRPIAARSASLSVAVLTRARGKLDIAALLGSEGLRDERRHAGKTLPQGIRRELRRAVTAREFSAVQRASPMFIGLGAAGLGYLVRKGWSRVTG